MEIFFYIAFPYPNQCLFKLYLLFVNDCNTKTKVLMLLDSLIIIIEVILCSSFSVNMPVAGSCWEL
jgi:hypothetical protein